MRIAIVLYDINNLGGIINHTEELATGFKELGHEVNLLQLCWKETVSDTRRSDMSSHELGAFGLRYHQGKGWRFPKQNRIPYKGKHNREAARDRLSKYDIVIWTIPVPTKQRDNQGNMDWLTLYENTANQIFVVHDGNMRKAYPHIRVALEIAQKRGQSATIAGVHPCGYNAATALPYPRAMILNPQPPMPAAITPWRFRDRGFLSCQTFKGWKHVHELVEAIAYLPHPDKAIPARYMAGGGIEYNYLTSADKCKPEYHHGSDSQWPGRKFWDVALENGMEWLDYIDTMTRDTLLHRVTCLVDPSWSRNYASVGDHFNRVVVDAIRMGAIPIARPLGISDNAEGVGQLFRPHEHYVPIYQGASPASYANIIEHACSITESEASVYHEAGRELFKHFDRRRVADHFISLASGFDAGFYGTLPTGLIDADIIDRSHKLITEFFDVNS